MAFLENGSPVATKLGPIANLTTTVGGKAAATLVFTIPNTNRFWLDMVQTTAGTYSFVTSTGTATIYVFDTADDLIHEISVTTNSSSTDIVSDFSKMVAVASTGLDLSVTPSLAKVTDAGGTITLDTLTASGNYATAGGTSGNYTEGQYAHVIVIGPGGGGGGTAYAGPNQYSVPGGGGSIGGVSATTTAFALTGTYAITVGAGGAGGASAQDNVAQAGSAGSGPTNAFDLTSNQGGGGGGGQRVPIVYGANGTAGTPAMPANTDIFLAPDNTKLGLTVSGVNQAASGHAGKVLVLRWTP